MSIYMVSDMCYGCNHPMHKHTYRGECMQIISDPNMGLNWYTHCSCKEFRIDNLTLIERMAEERSLI